MNQNFLSVFRFSFRIRLRLIVINEFRIAIKFCNSVWTICILDHLRYESDNCKVRLIIDAHLDLAWNATSFDRDLTLSLNEMNQVEQYMDDVRFRGKATTTFPEMRKGNILLAIGTFIARSGPEHRRKYSYLRWEIDFNYRIGAYASAYAQYAAYRLWEQQGHIRLIKSKQDFDDHVSKWQGSDTTNLPIGIMLSMEGADPIVTPEQLPEWHAIGLRAIGPSHYGFSQYAGGTAVDGPLTDDGRALLKGMQELNMGLDVTHLCDQSLEEALDLFDGVVWASHHNCRELVPDDRQLPDSIIKKLIERGAVIGAASDAWMLQPGWVIGVTLPEDNDLKIDAMADHIDHVCQLAGNSDHAALGSDLDGGYGTEQTPMDLKSIADLQKLDGILQSRGYSDADIDKIFYKNWLRILRTVLPDAS